MLNQYHQRAVQEGRHADGIDVIIVGRGGGSIEDLWAFNEEALARAIRASAIPIISAVGHETDLTIADFVADLRAATPSAAAEIVAAHEAQLSSLLERLTANLARSIQFKIAAARTHVQKLALAAAFDAPRARLRDAARKNAAAEHRLQTAMTLLIHRTHRRVEAAASGISPAPFRARLGALRERLLSLSKARETGLALHLDSARQQLGIAMAALDAMSPLRVLERGYAIAHDTEGKIVRDSSAVSINDRLRLRLWKGALNCRVEESDKT
jgi:exodeoxyribonuclease VII large subunit